MQRRIIGLVCVCLLAGIHAMAQNLPDDGPLTVRPALQQLGQRLLKGKQGSIVAVKPSTGEIICLATNSPAGSNVNLAIATAYPPGSTFKTAQALTLLSEGIITPETTIECKNGLCLREQRRGHQHMGFLYAKHGTGRSAQHRHSRRAGRHRGEYQLPEPAL